MQLKIYQVDAFTNKLFGGNPAAVIPLNSWMTDDILLKIAAENNLSETAFFVQQNDSFQIRWFTPKTEVALCGHATLASAHVLFHHLSYTQESITFKTRERGDLIVRMNGSSIEMNFPAYDMISLVPPDLLIDAIGKKPAIILKGLTDYCLVYDNEATVFDISPDFAQLTQLSDVRGVIVTSPSNDRYDFISRFFAPACGIDEDPVTGSAHTLLVPYWCKRLNKQSVLGFQASQRGGVVTGTYESNRVTLSGEAVTYLEGVITLP